MKRFLILGILLFSICISYGQNTKRAKKIYSMNDFVDIRISNGNTLLGTQSLTLRVEGLTYWIFTLPENKERKTKFIPFQDLDMEKFYKILKYVNEQKLYMIRKAEVSNDTVFQSNDLTTIAFMPYDGTLRYNELQCHICNKKIGTLIQLMNELIPEEDRKEFSIKLRSKKK